jgi:hypothetical protein
MGPRRTTALAIAGALAALSIGGCTFGTKASDSVPRSAKWHASHRATQAPPPSPTPAVTPSLVATTSAPDSPTTAPTGPTAPSSPSTSPTPTTTASTSASAEHLTTYQHLVVKLPVGDSAIPGAPAGFTDYVRSALDADWRKLGGTSGCEKAASIQVKRISSLGFAMVSRTIDPAIPTCVEAASFAGGYQAIIGVQDGTWTQLLALQDEPSCAKVEQLGIPRSIYGTCA